MPELVASLDIADFRRQDEPAESEATAERDRSFGILLHRVAPKDDVFALEYKTVLAPLDEHDQVSDSSMLLPSGVSENIVMNRSERSMLDIQESFPPVESTVVTVIQTDQHHDGLHGLYSRRVTLPLIQSLTNRSQEAIVHRTGPRDVWYQEDSQTLTSNVPTFHVENENFASSVIGDSGRKYYSLM